MSQSDNAHKYEYLNAISTEQLRELLQLEIKSDQDNDELVLQILGVIRERNNEEQTDSPSWQQARSDFDKYFNTPDGKGRSLYPTEVVQYTKRVTRSKSVIRWLAATAAILCIITFTMPPVLGYSTAWEMVAKWTDDILQIIQSPQNEMNVPNMTTITETYKSLQDALNEYHINTPVCPKYFPENYVFEDVSVVQLSDIGEVQFYAYYSDQTGNRISITVICYSNSIPSSFEKDTRDVTPYFVNNTCHYIYKNLDRSVATWYVDNLECSISTTESISILQAIVSSIYKE